MYLLIAALALIFVVIAAALGGIYWLNCRMQRMSHEKGDHGW